jgi:hypothetical protein
MNVDLLEIQRDNIVGVLTILIHFQDPRKELNDGRKSEQKYGGYTPLVQHR